MTKWYILYNYHSCNLLYSPQERHTRRRCIEADTLELALQKYNAFKTELVATGRDGRVLGLERIDQEEIITKIF